MKYRYVIFFVLLLGVAKTQAQYNYDMRDSRVQFGLATNFNFNNVGVNPGIYLKYAWKLYDASESAIGMAYYADKPIVTDSFSITAIDPNRKPAFYDTSSRYNYQHTFLFYQFNTYFLGTNYYSPYGFYLAGTAGAVRFRVTDLNDFKLDAPRYNYNTPYIPRKSGFSLYGMVGMGGHYQLFENCRAQAEAGLFAYNDRDKKVRQEGQPLRVGLNLQVGLCFGVH
ncbi:MAG: hypothetical protein EXR21_03180 [Flavobacteriaceae bacterium]|nr:hypothetical protein [Flavobacteriaceae bacterium]